LVARGYQEKSRKLLSGVFGVGIYPSNAANGGHYRKFDKKGEFIG
jgi:hypothetical protein